MRQPRHWVTSLALIIAAWLTAATANGQSSPLSTATKSSHAIGYAEAAAQPTANEVIVAHEDAAIASIKMIDEGEMIYASSHVDLGFSANLAMLGTPGEGWIDNKLASGRRFGYTFTYTPGKKLKRGGIRSYTITAVPDQVGTTGQRRFFGDESGEIRYNATGPADRSSPVIQ